MPVSWTRVPGAWPTINMRAFSLARRTGLGSKGRCCLHALQARTSSSSRLIVNLNVVGLGWFFAATFPRYHLKEDDDESQDKVEDEHRKFEKF